MNRTGFKPRTSPVRQVSKKRQAFRKSLEGKQAFAHMACVKELPCCICGAPGPSDAHHCFHGRFSTARASDYDTIPLCVECHRSPFPGAIHTSKSAWAAKHGPDYSYIQATRNAVTEMIESVGF